MEIKELGEFGLIDRFTKDIKIQNTSTVVALRDDAAVVSYGDKQTLVTTQMFMEGIQFDLTYIDMEHLAYKCAMATISNIFAMNGSPRQILCTIALGKRFGVSDLDSFYLGLRRACKKWNVDIVGGDTTSSYTGLAITLTCLGEAAPEDIVLRSGAHETDLICVTGDLGAAYMGLQILEREKNRLLSANTRVTCLGEAAPEDIVLRSGAHETDLICVTGDLGAAYMGLQILEREKNRLLSANTRVSAEGESCSRCR